MLLRSASTAAGSLVCAIHGEGDGGAVCLAAGREGASERAMAIWGLIRGYKRWNPVHPTYGAFWGVGVGVGCGVGWGPGFGPEVVGFVGSGCGVGFSMGLTLLGVGIGLPASGVACLPCNVVTGAGQRVSQVTTIIVPILSSFAIQTWQSMGTHISLLDEQLRLRNQGTGDRSFNDQIARPIIETAQQNELHDFNRGSPVKFSTSRTVIPSSQQAVRSESPHDK